jgi:SAM-dependent methyltransferase
MDWNGIVAFSWDIIQDVNTQHDSDFYYNLLKDSKGKSLELGCGTGRLLIPYLMRGLQVEGIDASEDMLTVCREKCKNLNISPILYNQKMEEMLLPYKYDKIYIPYGTFQILTEKNQVYKALQNIYNYLNPQGQLILSLFSPYINGEALSKVPLNEWLPRGEGHINGDSKICLQKKRVMCNFSEQILEDERKYQIIKNKKVVKEEYFTTAERWYFKNEMLLLLEKFGFETIEVLGDYSKEAFSDKHSYMVFVATK